VAGLGWYPCCRLKHSSSDELEKCRLDLLALLEVRKENTCTKPTENYTLLYGKGKKARIMFRELCT